MLSAWGPPWDKHRARGTFLACSHPNALFPERGALIDLGGGGEFVVELYLFFFFLELSRAGSAFVRMA